MMKELWKDAPIIMVIWFIGVLLTISFWGFVVWVIVKLLSHFGII